MADPSQEQLVLFDAEGTDALIFDQFLRLESVHLPRELAVSMWKGRRHPGLREESDKKDSKNSKLYGI